MSKAEIKFPLKSDALIENIDAWWAAFAEYEGELNSHFSDGKEIEPPLLEFISKLKTVHPEMCWEFSKGENKPHRFTLAPERHYPLEPVARLIKERAPSLTYFDVGVHRDATPWEWISGEADSRFTWDSHDGIYVSHGAGEHNFIDLAFHIPESKSDAKQEANSFLLAELALGEKVVSDWIGYVDTDMLKSKGVFKKKTEEPPAEAYPIKDIRSRVAAEIARRKNALPEKPFSARVKDMGWSLVEISSDNPDGTYLHDMYIATLCDANLFSAMFTGRNRFNSQRFSSLGESFVVIQINGESSKLDIKDVSSRGAIEDALSDALEPKSLGAVVGGGMGRENAYIFLALEKEAEGLDLVVDTLRAEKLGEKTWIFFYDSRRQYEWVGLWDDTPEPELSDR